MIRLSDTGCTLTEQQSNDLTSYNLKMRGNKWQRITKPTNRVGSSHVNSQKSTKTIEITTVRTCLLLDKNYRYKYLDMIR